MTSLDRILKKAKKENKVFIDLNFDIREQVLHILENHPTIKSQKQLAEKLKKKESEVSRMLGGLQNLTLESISKLTSVLGSDIIMTDLKAREKYQTALSNFIVFDAVEVPDIHSQLTETQNVIERLQRQAKPFITANNQAATSTKNSHNTSWISISRYHTYEKAAS